jgi:hypothetical protein
MGQHLPLRGAWSTGSAAPFADVADRAPHLFKDPIGDVETTRCPPAAGIFCRTLAAKRFTAVIRWVL